MMKQIHFNKSNLWSLIDSKHNPAIAWRTTQSQVSLKPESHHVPKLGVSLFVKSIAQIETKLPYMDIDGLGYGHKFDQGLTPRLMEVSKEDDKFTRAEKLMELERQRASQ